SGDLDQRLRDSEALETRSLAGGDDGARNDPKGCHARAPRGPVTESESGAATGAEGAVIKPSTESDLDGQKRLQLLGQREGHVFLHRLELFDGPDSELLAGEGHDFLDQDLGSRSRGRQ